MTNDEIDNYAAANWEALTKFYGEGRVEKLVYWAKRSACKSDPLGCPRCSLSAFASGYPLTTNEFQCAPC